MENKNFKPFVPADKVVPEFTVFSVVLGAILAVLFGGRMAYKWKLDLNIRSMLNSLKSYKKNIALTKMTQEH